MTRLFISAHKWKSLNFRLTFPDRVYRLRPYSSYSRDESAIPKLRWLELRRLLKATSLLGLAVGGTGTAAEIIILSTAFSQRMNRKAFHRSKTTIHLRGKCSRSSLRAQLLPRMEL